MNDLVFPVVVCLMPLVLVLLFMAFRPRSRRYEPEPPGRTAARDQGQWPPRQEAWAIFWSEMVVIALELSVPAVAFLVAGWTVVQAGAGDPIRMAVAGLILLALICSVVMALRHKHRHAPSTTERPDRDSRGPAALDPQPPGTRQPT